MAARVVTFGCRLNAFESEVIRAHADAAGLNDTIVVNTCTVTAEAERQARQAIRRLKREHPRSRIVVTGCAAQRTPETFAAMAQVDRVLGNAEKMDPATWRAGTLFDDGAPTASVGDIARVRETAGHLVHGFDGRARAFVEIQQGCDHRCTFCVIPSVRGPNRGVPAEVVVERVRTLVSGGYREAVLTGVDICSYGNDLDHKMSLGALALHVLTSVPDLERLRLSTVDPAAVDDDVIALLADQPRLMPHLHLSLQAGDDMVLKRMRRRHARADVAALCARARAARPDVVFGADVIAGFPTETDAMFDNTLAFVHDLGLTYLHVFPYSPRPGTAAARMPQVPAGVRRQRAARLRSAGNAALTAYLHEQVGAATTVLVERDDKGRTPHYAPVRLDAPAAPGHIVPARLTGVAEGTLLARVAA